MTGLCGWAGAPVAGSAEMLMASMADGLPAQADQRDDGCVAGGASVWGRGWPGALHLHQDDDLVAALVGECTWSDPDLAALARAQGHAAALASAFRAHEENLFVFLHGPFSLAVLCPRRGTALLAIDRMGIHGMCFAMPPGGGLVFGTTTDAIRAHPAVESTVTPQTLCNFLHFYVCPAPTTIYAEHQKLLPGHYLVFDGTTARTGTYWQIAYREEERVDAPALAEELMARLRTAVRRAAIPSEAARTGAFLSGGLDSSTVCGLLSELSDGPAKSFTIGFDEARYDESAYVDICVRHFGLEPHKHVLTADDAASFVPRLAAAYDEPFGNSSAIPAYYCAQLAAENGVSVMLAGDGGDEIFGGNERYLEQAIYERYGRLPVALRRHALSPLIRGLGRLDRISLFRRAANYVRMADTPLPDRLYARHPLVLAGHAGLFSPEAVRDIDLQAAFTLPRDSYHAVSTASRVQRMMRLDMQITLADNDLRKVVRMCELAGCRVRFPFLDEELVTFAAGIPPRMLVRGGRLRHFYKQAMAGFLPPQILAKQKHGFGMPFGDWIRSPGIMQELVCDSLSGLAARGHFSRAAIDALLADHRARRQGPLSDIVWDLMILELWWQSRTGRQSRSSSRPVAETRKRA